MDNSKKRKIIFLIIITAVAIAVSVGFLKKKGDRKEAVVTPAVVEKKTEAPVKIVKKTKFSSNAEIKKEYGRLETVTLWDGRTYTGAVINTTEVYTIVTVNGTVNIPMKNVKMRDIIR